MKHFLQIIRQLMASYLEVALTYRLDFFQSIFASCLWSAFGFLSAYLVTSQTPSVLGLSRADMLLLTSTYGIIVGTHHWFCTRGFQGFWEIIHKGELEGFLLKPFDTITFLSLRNINWGNAVRAAGSVLTTIWVIQYYHFSVSWGSVLLFGLLSVPAFLTIYSLYTICVTFLIWYPYLSNALELVNSGVGTARYPIDITRYTPRFLSMWFLPFMVIVNIPTQALVHQLDWSTAAYFVLFSGGLWIFSRRFWRYSLRHYTGASS